MNYLGDKPSSRVLRPPGGGGSNIFGTDEPASENKATNPTSYQKSSVFSTEPLPDKSVTNRRSVDTASNIFGASSAYTVSPKKVSKTLQSSVFSEPEPVKPSNGNQIPAPQESNGEKKETGGTAEENKSEPHLGPIKSMSGVRCAQPPGGKSSISFG